VSDLHFLPFLSTYRSR